MRERRRVGRDVINVNFVFALAGTEAGERAISFVNFHGAIAERAARMRESESFVVTERARRGSRERKRTPVLGAEVAGDLDERTIRSATVVVGVDVDLGMVAVRARRTFSEIRFKRHNGNLLSRMKGGEASPKELYSILLGFHNFIEQIAGDFEGGTTGSAMMDYLCGR